MKSVILGIAIAAALTGGTCLAQSTPSTTQNATPGATSPGATQSGMQNDRAARPSGMAPNDQAAASGDNNQAVTTTAANAATPAKGQKQLHHERSEVAAGKERLLKYRRPAQGR